MAWTLIIRSVLIIVKKRSHYYKEKNHESNFGFSKSSNMSSSSRDSSMISFRFLSSSIQKIELYATRICCIKYRRRVWYVRDSGLIIFQYWLILFFFLLLHVPTLSIYSSFGGHSQITVLGERVEKAPRTEFVVEPLVVIVRCAIYFIMQNSKY